MDFTGVWRNKNDGGSIGTSFGSIAYGNIYQTNLSEFRLSMQNSRVGVRFDAMVKGAHVIGYMEADFLGNLPANVLVSSNSNTHALARVLGGHLQGYLGNARRPDVELDHSRPRRHQPVARQPLLRARY